jgi:hypothetical protein
MYEPPRKPSTLPTSYNFRLVNRQLLTAMLNEPSQAIAAAVCLKDTAHSLRNRVHRGHFYTKAEVHRTRVAAATAVAALRALRLNNDDANRAADALVCFLRDEDYAPSRFGGAA